MSALILLTGETGAGYAPAFPAATQKPIQWNYSTGLQLLRFSVTIMLHLLFFFIVLSI